MDNLSKYLRIFPFTLCVQWFSNPTDYTITYKMLCECSKNMAAFLFPTFLFFFFVVYFPNIYTYNFPAILSSLYSPSKHSTKKKTENGNVEAKKKIGILQIHYNFIPVPLNYVHIFFSPRTSNIYAQCVGGWMNNNAKKNGGVIAL